MISKYVFGIPAFSYISAFNMHKYGFFLIFGETVYFMAKVNINSLLGKHAVLTLYGRVRRITLSNYILNFYRLPFLSWIEKVFNFFKNYDEKNFCAFSYFFSVQGARSPKYSINDQTKTVNHTRVTESCYLVNRKELYSQINDILAQEKRRINLDIRPSIKNFLEFLLHEELRYLKLNRSTNQAQDERTRPVKTLPRVSVVRD